MSYIVETINMERENEYFPDTWSHPGEELGEKLKEMNMTVTEFAKRTSYTRQTIFDVINGKTSITEDMAKAFEIVTKIPYYMFTRHQAKYDEYKLKNEKK